MRPTRYILRNTLGILFLGIGWGGFWGLMGGWAWAWGAVSLLLLVILGLNVWSMSQFARWTHTSLGTPLPRLRGSWDWLLADLGKRLRQHQAIRQTLDSALSRFQQASEALPDAVVFLDPEDGIVWCNTKAEKMFGLSGQKDVGQPITRLIRIPAFSAHLAGAQSEGTLALPTQVGTALVQVVSFGEAQRMVVARDITQLEKLEAMRRDFIANISHEMRTPLTVIGGFLEILATHGAQLSTEDFHQYVKQAQMQSEKMQRLVDDLLTLAALETSNQPAQNVRVAVGPLAEMVFQEAKLLSGGRHTFQLDASLPLFVMGSERELRSAFSNLAANAVRYTPEGGHITLLLTQGAVDQRVEFTVKDTGIGIPAEHISRLTERFYRVDPGRSGATGGTGLGLAIVKHVANRHQGQLRIVSSFGQGSSFTLSLPSA